MPKPVKPLLLSAATALAALWAQPAAAGCYCPNGGMLHEGAQTCMIPDGRGGLAPIAQATCTNGSSGRQERVIENPNFTRCAPRQGGGQVCRRYWKSTGSVDFEYETDSQGRFDGKVNQYNYYSTIQSSFTYRAGKLNGEARMYDEDGKLKWLSHYRDDQEHGEARHFYPSGKLKAVEFYENGEKNGVYKGWHENGKLMFVTKTCRDNRCAPLLEYDENGNLESRTEYSEDGKFKRAIGYDPQGRPHGREIVGLYRNGKAVQDKEHFVLYDYIVEWKHGVKDGDEIHYKSFPKRQGKQWVDYTIKWKDGRQVSR